MNKRITVRQDRRNFGSARVICNLHSCRMKIALVFSQSDARNFFGFFFFFLFYLTALLTITNVTYSKLNSQEGRKEAVVEKLVGGENLQI